MHLPWSWLAGLLVLALVGGCTAMKPDEIASPTLDGSAWVLAELPGAALAPGAPAALRFEAGHHAPDVRRAGPMEQEQAFLKALEGVRTMRIEGSRLELRDDHGALMASFVDAAAP